MTELNKNTHILGLQLNRQPDLLIVNSPLNIHNTSFQPNIEMLPPIGLAHIATECQEAGYNVGLVDPETSNLTPEKTARLINEANPRWVGINLLTPTYSLARRIITNLKPGISVMVGGAHAKALPEKTLRDPFIGRKIKALVLEDGELIAKELLDGTPQEEMEGIAYINKNGDFIMQPLRFTERWTPLNLDSLHFVNRNFLPNDPFLAEGRMETNISSSRGCYFNCAFCAGARNLSPVGIRSRSLENILNELTQLREQGISAVRFIDDLFLVDKHKIRQFSEAMLNTGLSQDFVWDATGRANIIASLDREVLQLLSLSGCREIAIGVESGSERILEIINKKIKPEMVIESVQSLAEVGIRTKGYFILGIPSETKGEMLKTINFMHQLKNIARKTVVRYPRTDNGEQNRAQFRGSTFEFRPYPGTFLYQCLTGKQPWPAKIYEYGFKPDIYSEDDILSSFSPVYIDQLETRQRHNYGINAPLADGVLPYEIQDLISEAMQPQQTNIMIHEKYSPELRREPIQV